MSKFEFVVTIFPDPNEQSEIIHRLKNIVEFSILFLSKWLYRKGVQQVILYTGLILHKYEHYLVSIHLLMDTGGTWTCRHF